MTYEDKIIGYAAGVLDADGTIQLNRRKDCDSYQLAVSVSSVNESIPFWLERNFPGGKVYKFFMSKERRQPVYRWAVYSNNALLFLRFVEPLLTEKKERAKLAIHYQSNLISLNRQGVSDEIKEERKHLFNNIKTLNAKTGRNHWIGAKLED